MYNRSFSELALIHITQHSHFIHKVEPGKIYENSQYPGFIEIINLDKDNSDNWIVKDLETQKTQSVPETYLRTFYREQSAS